jgi:hypothetical protein
MFCGNLNSDLLKEHFEVHRVPDSCRSTSEFGIRAQFRVVPKQPSGTSVVPVLGGTSNSEDMKQEFRKHPVFTDLTLTDENGRWKPTKSNLVQDDRELLKCFLACSSYNEENIDKAVTNFELMKSEKQERGSSGNREASRARGKYMENNCRKVSIYARDSFFKLKLRFNVT